MRKTTHIKFSVVVIALLVCACQIVSPTPSATPVPMLTHTPSPSPTPTPTLTPTPTPTPRPTLAPLPDFEPWPTPTVPEPSIAGGTFTDPEYGVTMTYPAGWEAGLGEPDSGTLVWFANAEASVFADLFLGSASADETLKDVAADLRDGYVDFLIAPQVIRDEMIVLDDGREAWTILLTGVWPGGSLRLKTSLTIAIRGGRAYVVRVLGLPTEYDRYAGEIDALVGALQLGLPSVYGIPRDQVVVYLGGESTNPREYDPAATHGGGNKRLFGGLVSFDPEMNVVPDLAESWQVEGGTIYTFTLRAGARFHDGRPVTAHDVVYSWERAADPELESDTVLAYLGDVVGVKEMREGEADHIVGIAAVDDHTLRVTIDAPKPYFLHKLTYPVAFVVDRANIAMGDDWYRTPNGTGPYRMVRWERFEVQIYERYEDYHLEPPAIPYVVNKLFAGVGIRLYETGDIDVTGIGAWNVPRVLDPDDPLHPDVMTAVNLCTSFIFFDVEQPPFDDPKVRQAFTMAFDRQQYIDIVMEGIALPAKGLYPPGLPGYNGDLEGLPHDPARARQLLADSRYGGPEGLPPIVYTTGGIGSYVGSTAAALAEMWQRDLGITITVENLEPDKYQDKIDAGYHGQIFSGGWCADYADPENFADVLFHSDSMQNEGHYSNPELDALLERARVEPDVTKRIEMYQQAEQMIVEDAPVLFTTHSLSYVLVKPYIKGYVMTPVGVPLTRFLWIDPEEFD
jgi:oligopeptide transport system substrate-binding protein